jgi:hypothetical protein
VVGLIVSRPQVVFLLKYYFFSPLLFLYYALQCIVSCTRRWQNDDYFQISSTVECHNINCSHYFKKDLVSRFGDFYAPVHQIGRVEIKIAWTTLSQLNVRSPSNNLYGGAISCEHLSCNLQFSGAILIYSVPSDHNFSTLYQEKNFVLSLIFLLSVTSWLLKKWLMLFFSV